MSKIYTIRLKKIVIRKVEFLEKTFKKNEFLDESNLSGI